jgi:SAM-dependent methyltransferase
MISQEQFVDAGVALSREAGVLDGLHGYFMLHRSRIYEMCRHFGLLEGPLGDVLEIGPFYSYTPFVLRDRAKSYTVLEGDDPAAYPLKPLYEKRKVDLRLVDLFEMFGPTHTASHSLPFPDNSFDTFMCWATMEHFNFNPVKFVREVRRVLKPGGKAFINVPNKASFQNITSLLNGRFEISHVDAYFDVEDYSSNGKKAFYGFHWREYSAPELARLFSKADLAVRSCKTMVTFQDHQQVSAARKVLRGGTRVLAALLPRYGTDVCLIAEKTS